MCRDPTALINLLHVAQWEDDDIHLFDGIVLVNVGESKPSRSFPILVGNPTLLLQDGTFKRKIQLNEMKIKNY